MNIQPSVGRGHLTPPVPWLTALCIFCEEPLTICRGRRPRRPGQAYISFDICGQLRGRAASPLAAGEGIMLYSFRLCVGNHPSVRCADSFPQGKPNHRAGGGHMDFLWHPTQSSGPVKTVPYSAFYNEQSTFPCIPPVGAPAALWKMMWCWQNRFNWGFPIQASD